MADYGRLGAVEWHVLNRVKNEEVGHDRRIDPKPTGDLINCHGHKEYEFIQLHRDEEERGGGVIVFIHAHGRKPHDPFMFGFSVFLLIRAEEGSFPPHHPRKRMSVSHLAFPFH